MLDTLAVLFLGRDVDFTIPHNLWMARILYGVSLAIQVGVGFYVQSVVRRKNDQSLITLPPAAAGAPEVTQTVMEHDLAVAKQFVSQVLQQAVFMWVMTFLIGNVMFILLMNTFSGVFRMIDWEMFRIHVLDESSQFFPELTRPFKKPDPMAMLSGFFGGNSQQEEEERPPPIQREEQKAPVPRVQVIDDVD